MKKYKLIQEYPGSPKLGTVVMNGIIGVNKNNPCLSFDGSRRLRDIELPHKYPEFWEEVVEKDYEILSITYPTNDRICEFDEYLSKIYNNEQHFFECFIKAGYNIRSIKRLSDGEVFTVGDKVKTSVSDSYCSIYSFNIKNNTLVIDCTHSYLAQRQNVNLLEDIQHYPKPLFTTEDDVDIYEGDAYYMVNDGSNSHKYMTHDNPFTIVEFLNGVDRSRYTIRLDDMSVHRFSTKEAAEEYILMNKPTFSLNDVIASIPKNTSHYSCITNLIENLKNM